MIGAFTLGARWQCQQDLQVIQRAARNGVLNTAHLSCYTRLHQMTLPTGLVLLIGGACGLARLWNKNFNWMAGAASDQASSLAHEAKTEDAPHNEQEATNEVPGLLSRVLLTAEADDTDLSVADRNEECKWCPDERSCDGHLLDGEATGEGLIRGQRTEDRCGGESAGGDERRLPDFGRVGKTKLFKNADAKLDPNQKGSHDFWSKPVASRVEHWRAKVEETPTSPINGGSMLTPPKVERTLTRRLGR